MNPPFSITIEITEATQCHAAVSQLLRVFPSLRLTITENEAKSITSRLTQADLESFHSYIAACFSSVYPRADPRRFRDAIDKAAGSGRLGADEARQAAERAVARAEADAVHSQNISECNAEAAKRAEADAIDRGDNHKDADTDVDDGAYT